MCSTLVEGAMHTQAQGPAGKCTTSRSQNYCRGRLFTPHSAPPRRCCRASYVDTSQRCISGTPLASKPQSGCSTRCRAKTCTITAGALDKQTVALTGATGLVGTRLVERLLREGATVRVLTRNVGRARQKCPGAQDVFGPEGWPQAVLGADAVINLAGEPIGTRWTASIKSEIMRSRVEVTRRIVASINGAPEDQRPKVFINSSAVGYYGCSQARTFNEDSSSGSDYLSEVCRRWEAEAAKAKTERTVILRTGIVLAREGGALGKMLPVFNIFAGGPLGNGQQWCSWIHRDDLVSLFVEALANPEFRGTYNATAPNPVRMSELCSCLGATLGRPSWLPVPDFALQVLLGEGAQVVLDGQRVLPKRAQEQGFRFAYPEVGPAIREVLAH